MRRRERIAIIFCLCLIVSLSAACVSGVDSGNREGEAQTAAAFTVAAKLTQAAFATLEGQLTAVAQGSDATAQPVASATTVVPVEPTQTPSPTFTSSPSPTITMTPIPCDRAEFVKDITAPDGTAFYPEVAFNKTWRLYNSGSCTWTTEYSLVFVDGDAMGGPLSSSLTKVVAPGETIDVTARLTAPNLEGLYDGKWMLRNAEHAQFGIGEQGQTPFWVEIIVENRPELDDERQHDFVHNMRAAIWRTGTGVQPAPGRLDNFVDGSITINIAPRLEGGYQDDEPALIMIPSGGSSGYISGHYPAITIKDGDHFRSLVGCLYDSPDCDVDIQLNYNTSDGGSETLGVWREKSEGGHTQLDVDLSQLKDKEVELTLMVRNNGVSDDDRIFWLAPEITNVN